MRDTPSLGERVMEEARVLGRATGLSAWRGLKEFYGSEDLTYAASIAYYALLSLFPFLLIALAILGSVTVDESNRRAVLTFVLRYFPTQFEFLTQQLDAFRETRLQIGVVGGLGLIWGSLGVFGAISSAVNYAWGVEKPRSFWGHRLFSFLMLAAAGGLLLLALVLSSAIQLADASRFNQLLLRFPMLGVLRGFTIRYAIALLPSVVFGLIYYYVPNVRVPFRDVWVPAIVTGLLWRGGLAAFAWYVRDMTRFNALHGSVAAVVVFLLWIYISAAILLYGVEVTASYSKLRGEHRARPRSP